MANAEITCEATGKTALLIIDIFYDLDFKCGVALVPAA